MKYHTKFGTVEVDKTKEWWKGFAYLKREDLLPDHPDYFMPYEAPDGEIIDLPTLDPCVYHNVAKEDRNLAPLWFIASSWEGDTNDQAT